jgi:hypothetical protein
MRKLFATILLFISAACFGQTRDYITGAIFVNASTTPITVDTIDIVYPSAGRQIYVSNYGSDANTGIGIVGNVVNTAIATIAKLNTLNLQPDDSVHFKNGQIFPGSIILKNSGTTGHPITICSYGKTGAAPIITGLKTLTGWTNAGGGIWNITISEGTANMNVITMDNNIQRMGRYPNFNTTNEGWLFYSSFTGTNTLNTSLTGTPNWMGANAVYKQRSYLTNSVPITAQSGGTLTLGTCYAFDGSVVDMRTDVTNYGFFIQNDIRTLDTLGEWYFNPSTKLFSMYFGTDNPTAHTIKASIFDRIIDLGSGGTDAPAASAYSNITVTNLNIQGGNKFGIQSFNGANNSVKNCNITQCYNGVMFWNIPNGVVNNNNISYINNDAIMQLQSPTGTTNITNNNLSYIGQMEGLAGNFVNTMQGIWTAGANVNVTGNRLDWIGHTGIYFNNSNVLIKNNYITNFCNRKDDAGGIYTFGDTGSVSNRIVDHNILVNGIGAKAGRPNDTWNGVAGLYSDGESQNTQWINNTISNVQGEGVLSNTSVGVKFDNNTFYNINIGINMNRIAQTPAHQYCLRDTITNNIIWATDINYKFDEGMLQQPTSSLTFAQDVANIGLINNNYYRTTTTYGPFNIMYSPTNGGLTYNYLNLLNGDTNLSFSNWKSFSGKDAGSSQFTGSSTVLYINPTLTTAVISIGAGTYTDPTGTTFTGNITLAPYTSKILIYTATP